VQDGTRISVTVETIETDTGPIIWDMKQYEWLDQIPQIPMALRRQILAAIVATVDTSVGVEVLIENDGSLGIFTAH
jgi:hypothetical protein